MIYYFVTNHVLFNYCLPLYFFRLLPHIRASRGVGPSSLSQCIDDLLGEWEELKAYYINEKSESVSPLVRAASSEDQPGSQTRDELTIDNSIIDQHLQSSAKMYTRMHL